MSSRGASVNAYTSNTKTAFMCSCTINFRKNLETLLDFVQAPFFTSCSVEDEKSIIAQEIQMYEDDPDWNLTRGLIENLYPDHPVRIDVAGTEESVRKISVAMLQSNYDTFYNPENMQLVIIGNCDPYETLEWIRENQSLKNLSEPRRDKTDVCTRLSNRYHQIQRDRSSSQYT
ncbi:MAG: pitrilysin family protein [Alkalibacterium sp.]|nr:pitrilysin family protein [Alkalibacterium sp.]